MVYPTIPTSEYRPADVISNISRELNIAPSDAEALFEDLKLFLHVCASSKQSFAPPKAIDAAWHQFILFTEYYQEFCIEHYGKMIHHRPVPIFGTKFSDARLSVADYVESTFNVTLSKNWDYDVAESGGWPLQADCDSGVRSAAGVSAVDCDSGVSLGPVTAIADCDSGSKVY